MVTRFNCKFLKPLLALLVLAVVGRRVFRAFWHDREPVEEGVFVEDTSTFDQLSPNYRFSPAFSKPGYKRDDLYPGRIPQIIHQIWDTYRVPKSFEKWMKTWKMANPNWQHWFWSLKDARKLIEAHYPKYLTLYDSYLNNAFRADAARYFIIHYFGGVYVDLDMMSLRSMDNWTHEYDCIVSEEPYEHSFLVREQNDSNILNGFIACKEQHPFLGAAIDSLMEAAGLYFGDLLKATGPFFLTNVYNKWQGKNEAKNDRVVVVPPKYFFPTYDRSESETLSTKCLPRHFRSLPLKGQVICRNLYLRGFNNEVDKESYTDHYWLHSYMFGESFKTENVIDISQIIPTIIPASTQV